MTQHEQVNRDAPQPVFQWLGTAGFRVEFRGTVILIDPYLSRNPGATPAQNLTAADMGDAVTVFLSHGHFDHLADVPDIVKASGASVYCSPVAARTLARKGVSADLIHELSGGESLPLSELRVDVTASSHIIFDPALIYRSAPRILKEFSKVRPHIRGMPAGPVLVYTFHFDRLSVTHIGSLGLKPQGIEEAGLETPDILMPPLQGHTHICRLAAEFARALGPRAVVPQHFDDFFPPVSQSVRIEPFERMVRGWLPNCAYYKPVINRRFGVEDIFGSTSVTS